MNRPLVIAGIALVVTGAIVFFVVMGATSGPEDFAPVTAQDPVLLAEPSRLWSVLAGIVFAAGLAMVGIGMNRWRQHGTP